MTGFSLHYPLGGGAHRFSAAAWVVLMHLAVLWAVMALSPQMPPPEDKDLQTLVIQDIAIVPPPPKPLPTVLPAQTPEKAVPTPPPAPLEPAPAPTAVAAPTPTPTSTPALVQPQVPVLPTESRPSVPATVVLGSQFPAAAAPARHYAPSAAPQSPVVAEASRGASAAPAPGPTPAPAPVAAPAPAPAPPPVPAMAAIASAVAPRTAIDAVCPPELQVKPEMPVKAKDEPGDEWLVSASITIRNTVVTDVKILSGPKVFHDSVRKAIRQYRCKTDGGQVVVTQVLRFKLQ